VAEVFISYSRADTEFVRNLHSRLEHDRRETWVDWEGIPLSAEWLAEIERAIESADTFVFAMSAKSLASEVCAKEWQHALRYRKRMVPVVIEHLAGNDVPDPLAKLNWLFFRPEDDFDKAYAQLITTIDTDLDWARAHSRLLVRAREWEVSHQDPSFLLAGTDLEESERWLTEAFEKKPELIELQVKYISASRAQEISRQHKQLRGFYLVSIIYGLLQSGVSYFVAFDEISEEGLIALSPLWVLGVIFGGFGLTLGRRSLRRSIIATVVAGLLLYLFFITIWGAL
jgi:hypothetical protein